MDTMQLFPGAQLRRMSWQYQLLLRVQRAILVVTQGCFILSEVLYSFVMDRMRYLSSPTQAQDQIAIVRAPT
jgi:hypothetical protein